MQYLTTGATLFLLAIAGSGAAHDWVLAPEGGQLQIMTVGDDQACDYNDLESAIAVASSNANYGALIRLSRDLDDQQLSISGRNLIIDGRFASCSSASPQAGLRRTIRGNGTHAVIVANSFEAEPRQRFLSLRGIVVRGGMSVSGGGVRINDWVTAHFNDTLIGGNGAFSSGGGVHVTGTNAIATFDDGTIIGAVPTQGLPGNQVTGPQGAGGGIRCVNGAQVVIRDARIRSNTSSGNGGGIAAEGCDLQILPRAGFVGVNGSQSAFVTLFENQAAGNGGGLFADVNASVLWAPAAGVNSFAGRAVGNRAGLRGGAVFLQGGSAMTAQRVRFEGNRADDRGGAFAVQDAGTTLALGSETGHRRCTGGNCPGIFGTRAITEGAAATLIGGAIYAQGGAVVTAWQTQLFDNFAANGSALHASGSTTLVELNHSLVASNFLYGNGNGTSTIEATGSADLTLHHVTMAQNFRFSSQFPFFERAASSIRANGNNSVVVLRNSLLWNDAQLLIRLLVGASVEASCVFGHEEISVFGVHALDPRYVSPSLANPNYHLQDDSSAIDFCFNPPASRPRDLFGTRRAVDWPDVPMFFGEHDAGAIEMRIPGDAIFVNWFEFED